MNSIRQPDAGADVYSVLKGKRFIGTWRGIRYLNAACSFDIETSSWYENGEKRACMYIWMFAADDEVITGRTWESFESLIMTLRDSLGLDISHRLIVYVHNLGYEFQWIRCRFEWYDVFALKARRPLYAVTTDGIEFRCSWLLSGYSLERLGDTLKDGPDKLTGDLDYRKLRHSGTPLDDREMAYCINDVLVVTAYIRQQIERDGDITKIPLTKTGYVRNFCRRECLGTSSKPKRKYRDMIKKCRMTITEYEQLKRVYAGGFTHANAWYNGDVLEDVASYDFTSSYPAVMLSEQFPMGAPRLIDETRLEKLEQYMDSYCCMFDARFTNIRPRLTQEHYVSYSKCWDCVGAIRDNGRIVRADVLNVSITECDYSIIERFYMWDSLEISNFRAYRKEYLPRDFMNAILDLYQMKTELKGVAGREYDYARGKEMLNSAYGMCVTSPTRDIITYENAAWFEEEPETREALGKHNDAGNRFLYYPWGVWVTAYARLNLFTGIVECGPDYVYSDTDSIKTLNREAHLDYFTRYNAEVTERVRTALEAREIDPARAEPLTKDGVRKPIGVWDYEGTYTLKTLGAKRYLMRDEKTGRLILTVAGVAKSAVKYLEDMPDPFAAFCDNLTFPASVSGKLTHTYIDRPTHGRVVDYLGNEGGYDELSSIHMEPSGYGLSLADEYRRYLQGMIYEYM